MHITCGRWKGEFKMPNKAIGQGSIFYNKARDNWTVLYYEKDIKTGKKKRKSKSQPTK